MRRRRTTRATVGVILVSGMTLVACGDDGGGDEEAATAETAETAETAASAGSTSSPGESSDTTGGTAGEPNGETGAEEECTDEQTGSITMGVYSETAGLDPTVSTGGGVTGATELTAIYDTLVEYNEETHSWDPRLAESLEATNDDASEWTLTLSEDIAFGNGDPLTAEAVKASIERHQSEETTIRSRGLSAAIASMEVVDELTLDFTLSEPWGTFPYLLAGEVGMIVNPAVVEELGTEEFNTLPVGGGAGPYEPVRFESGEEIVLEAKDDYWGGPVCIEELRFVTIAGAEATYDAFRNGEIDVAFLREPRVIEQAAADGVQSYTELLNAGEIMLINSGAEGSEPPTADVRLRRAIAHAVDPAQIDQRAHEGAGLPSSAIVHPDSRYYDGAEGPEHDPELAAQLVEEVKAEGEWDGSITLACDNTWSEEALSVEAQLEAVGFEVEADITSTVADRIQRVIVDHDYDVACWGMSLSEASPWTGLGRNVGSESASGRTGYSSADMDAALSQLKAAQSLEEEQAALAEVQAVWNETIPSIVTAATAETIIWQDEVQGLGFNQETVTLFDDATLS